jgi:acyl-coenzyme A synthetase/AMP-(fatty) acid ligase
VENVLLGHPAIVDVAVVPMSDDVKGEVPVAFVIERTGGAAAEQEVKEFFLKNGAPYMHPRRVFVLPEMPLTSAKKVDRSALKKMAAERRDAR